jgi:hypothetical protein
MENYSRNSPIEVVENGEKPIAKRTRVSEAVFGVENLWVVNACSKT